MQPSVNRHARFEEDCKKYQLAIDAITDQSQKDKSMQTLMNLINNVRAIDNLHDDITALSRNSAELSQLRATIISLRKQLDSICNQL